MTLRQMINKNLKEDIDPKIIQQLVANNANTLKQAQLDQKTLMSLQQQLANEQKQKAAAQTTQQKPTNATTASNVATANNLSTQGSQTTASGTSGSPTATANY